MAKNSISLEAPALLNIYVPNKIALKLMMSKIIEPQRETEKSTIKMEHLSMSSNYWQAKKIGTTQSDLDLIRHIDIPCT